MASTSGRSMEASLRCPSRCNAYSRSFVVLPSHRGVCRVAFRQRTVTCEAVALRSRLTERIFRALYQLFRGSPKDEGLDPTIMTVEPEPQRQLTRKRSFGDLVKDATAAAVQAGLALTGVAIQLAHRLVKDLRRSASVVQTQHQAKELAAKARESMDEETVAKYDVQRQKLQTQGKDAAFVQMLKVLDRCHLDHDVKWALVQKHTADKAEFCERLQHLYKVAQASKDAVDTLLRPDASRKEINRFWKSAETLACIAEEDKLKQLVFAQMLQASS